MIFMAFEPGRTSTSRILRPTISFSRSRRTISTSGSAGIGSSSRYGLPLRRLRHGYEGLARRVLLRLLLRPAGARPPQTLAHVDLGGEPLVVIRSRGGHAVRRPPAAIANHLLLQRG